MDAFSISKADFKRNEVLCLKQPEHVHLGFVLSKIIIGLSKSITKERKRKKT